MSNLERDPAEVVAVGTIDVADERSIEVLLPREVPLGGPRAMNVRRTLPQRKRSFIGGWCFIDHYGPEDVSVTGGMRVPPHPHTGLQTVSWLFAGEIEHRDSVGSHAMVRPGELNLMTAGHGISHSEVSTAATTTLHGVQLWVALPSASRDVAPFFEHHVPSPAALGEAVVRTFVGSLAGSSTDATMFSPLLGAQLDLPAGASVSVPLDPAFEHGVLVDAGPVVVAGETIADSELAYLGPGTDTVELRAGETDARVLLLGGEPLDEQIVMWWNFIGRSHEDVVQFRAEWQRDVIDGEDAAGRFGSIPGYQGSALPAPELPTVRLKPRG
ncbi:pirin family protein [Diaminobutyricibacter sp. McL0618]|uniref:pirin family protein n=1 Tax=Leifsonia sp. McL0618 TaxID=3415677 RepID=UPI003CF6C7AE